MRQSSTEAVARRPLSFVRLRNPSHPLKRLSREMIRRAFCRRGVSVWTEWKAATRSGKHGVSSGLSFEDAYPVEPPNINRTKRGYH
jgi:hypothetical protein